LEDGPLLSASPDGSGVAVVERRVRREKPAYTVSRFGRDGIRIFRVTIPYQPRKITQADIDSLVEHGFGSSDLVPAGFRAERERIRKRYGERLWRPEHLLPVTAMLAASDGLTWLADTERDGKRVWTVLGADGHILYDVALPARANVIAAKGNWIWSSETDEDGVPFLRRFLLRG
jgi:hypothetical protein